ncbi:unnamed protein product, partial [Mesorhabditis belari]|uniref:Uncharacterized protein n=1 Tax=Mesorhabditis belari TaxID=2138241 RepID=A0AAF3EJI8_9BILA
MSSPVISDEPKAGLRRGSSSPPPRLGRQPAQVICPTCKTRVITEIQWACCPPFSTHHVCPQCNAKISQRLLDSNK